jgi:arginine-tRNA-protein transferase
LLKALLTFSDPNHEDLSWGTLSGLFEIGLIRRIAKRLPDLHYYYLGYYCPECPKLAYKARFKPSEVLQPDTLCWQDLE